jgi:hypothetical protein
MLENPHDISLFDIIGIQPANPGAGADLDFPCPVRARIRIDAITFTFTTDANVANRVVKLQLFDSATAWTIGLPTLVQTAATTRRFNFAPGIGSDRELLGGAPDNIEYSNLAWPLWLRFGDSLITSIQGLQVGDQISSVSIRYSQQITPS